MVPAYREDLSHFIVFLGGHSAPGGAKPDFVGKIRGAVEEVVSQRQVDTLFAGFGEFDSTRAVRTRVEGEQRIQKINNLTIVAVTTDVRKQVVWVIEIVVQDRLRRGRPGE